MVIVWDRGVAGIGGGGAVAGGAVGEGLWFGEGWVGRCAGLRVWRVHFVKEIGTEVGGEGMDGIV